MSMPNSPFSFEMLGAEVDRFLSGLSSYATEQLSAASVSAGEVKTTLKNIIPRIASDFAVDLTENETSFSITCELPGVEKENISVKLLNPTTVLIKTTGAGNIEIDYEPKTAEEATLEDAGAEPESTEKTAQKPVDEPTYHLHEIRSQSRQRTVVLPSAATPDGGKATFKNGILELILPKAVPGKETAIEIE